LLQRMDLVRIRTASLVRIGRSGRRWRRNMAYEPDILEKILGVSWDSRPSSWPCSILLDDWIWTRCIRLGAWQGRSNYQGRMVHCIQSLPRDAHYSLNAAMWV
jgi:hypothetical protein